MTAKAGIEPYAEGELRITEPGVYPDLPNAVYHADPVPGGSLSSTGARAMTCPAKFHWDRVHGRAPKRTFDFGHAAHREVLGEGDQVVWIDAEDYRTKAAREARDQAHVEGKVPMLAREREVVEAMAEQIRSHPIASALLNPLGGRPEVSLFWRDPIVPIMRRTRLDWLPQVGDRRGIFFDYKTCASADPEKLQRSIADYGYHQQAAWYLDAVQALGIAGTGEPSFLFICQEKDPPYVVTVVEPDSASLRIGRHLNRVAINTYWECKRTGVWPGYSTDVELLALPPYIESRFNLQEIEAS